MPKSEDHQFQIAERKKYTDLIVQSKSKNKVIVAGAGTGKSFTFQSVVAVRGKNSLALTFINSLMSELSKDLDGLAEVRTFHSYCKKLLHKISVVGIDSDFEYFPKLPLIIKSDSSILGKGTSNFVNVFQKLEEGSEIDFFIDRGNYYNAVGHDDAVYRVIKFFEANPDRLPKFNQVVVDEYQDFNELEVTFIDQLEKNSPILIAGDDDQAIYPLKNASPDYIRRKVNDPNYERFELPYCSRCTQVIVESTKDVILKASALGKLNKRIDKKYLCFVPDKEEDSKNYPKIVHASCSVQNKQDARNYIGRFIEAEIKKIPKKEIELARENKYPCVLIIGQSQYLKQVHGYLKGRFSNIQYKEKSPEEEIELIDGYKILMRNEYSNLGWRIILEFEHGVNKNKILELTNKNSLFDLIDSDLKENHLEIIRILKKIKAAESLTDKEKQTLRQKLDMSIASVKKLLSLSEQEDEQETDDTISIKLTTINSCKGLSGGFVFIIGMNNSNFPSNPTNPTDHEICQLIVAMTRTRKKCYMISNKGFGLTYGLRPSTFISWIKSSALQDVTVNANYFRNLNS